MILWGIIFGTSIALQKPDKKHRALISSAIASIALLVFDFIRLTLEAKEFGGLKILKPSYLIIVALVALAFIAISMFLSNLYDRKKLSKKLYIALIIILFIATFIGGMFVPVGINEDKISSETINSLNDQETQETEEDQDEPSSTAKEKKDMDQIANIKYRIPSIYTKTDANEAKELIKDSDWEEYKAVKLYNLTATDEDTLIVVGYVKGDFSNIDDFIESVGVDPLKTVNVAGVKGVIVKTKVDDDYLSADLCFIKNNCFYSFTAMSTSDTPEYIVESISETIQFK